jgi:uncharacterized membrane protein YsdA (DUF1294 family)
LLLAGFVAARVPGFFVTAYVGFSPVSYILYWIDKRAALAGRWRVAEANLHFVDVLGGWPGALIAQAQFRHKTSKTEFQIVFWITVVLNLAVVAWLWIDGHVPRLMKNIFHAIVHGQ